MLTISEDFKEIYPNAKFGVLIIEDIKNPPVNEELNKIKTLIKEQLLSQYQNYNRKEFVKSEPVCFYKNYYKKFKKTYPVLLQLESIVLKSKDLPNVSALVESMFIAELKNLLLTAGHDFDKIAFPLKLNFAEGNESFIGISQKEQFLSKNDMMLSDGHGIISSILNGPDYRTQITSETKNVLFFIYTPDGINENIILNHLNDINSYVSIFAPNATVQSLDIF